MTNLFLKVNKDLFKLKLNPTEILILSQVLEYQTNTQDCYISNQALASQFGVSAKTISRSIEALEEKGFLMRDTKNVRNGRERHMKVNLIKIDEVLARDNLSNENENIESSKGQNDLCARDNLSIGKGQNDSIKDNTKKIKEKDNLENQIPVEGTIGNPIIVNKEWLVARRNELVECANGIFKYIDKFYRMGG